MKRLPSLSIHIFSWELRGKNFIQIIHHSLIMIK